MAKGTIGRLAMGAGALFLCVGLAACNEKTQTKTVTVEKPCNCTHQTTVEDHYYPEPRIVRPRAKAHKRTYAHARRHYYARDNRRSYARTERDEFYAGGYQGEAAEIQSRSYSRSSYRDEHRYYRSEELTPMDRDPRYARHGSRYSAQASGQWVDGYGRVHYASAGAPGGQTSINSARARSTWHGYDVDCDDPDHRYEGNLYHTDHSKVGHGFD
jgi:hypothetical protein